MTHKNSLWKSIALLAALTVVACGGPDIEAEIVQKNDLQDFTVRGPHPVCNIRVKVTNKGSAKIERLGFSLRIGTKQSNGDGTRKGIGIGGDMTFILAFHYVTCADVTDDVEIVVASCLIGDTDCKNAVRLRR